jgi:5'-nucleotidase (lipoprotein e(P4) family)
VISRSIRHGAWALSFLTAACATPRAEPATRASMPAARDPTLFATLWVQTAAEYRATAWQAFAAAGASLRRALADSSITAATEQEGKDFADLPPAVVLDVDETVLDNSPFQARLILAGASYDRQAWADWVDEASAPAIPGAPEFLRLADSLGVAIYYVTNRDAELEAATRRNLAALGLPVDPNLDTVLTRGEREGWTSDKTSRREAVAARHRILVIIGDDFNDFVAARLPRAERDRLVARYRDRWGERWIVLPNPTYGSWEGALYPPGDHTEAEEDRLRLDALEDRLP